MTVEPSGARAVMCSRPPTLKSRVYWVLAECSGSPNQRLLAAGSAKARFGNQPTHPYETPTAELAGSYVEGSCPRYFAILLSVSQDVTM